MHDGILFAFAIAAVIGMASRWDGKQRLDIVKHTTLEFRP
jgi:hypothetical protein